MSPAVLMRHAADMRRRSLSRSSDDIGGIGLTDHDTVAGWAEAEAAVHTTGIALVRGMEVSCMLQDPGVTPERLAVQTHAVDGVDGHDDQRIPIHMLIYLADPTSDALARHMRRARSAREQRIEAMVRRLSERFPLTMDDVAAVTPAGAIAGRPHLADALIRLGIVKTRAEAFARFLSPGSPYYVELYSPDAYDVVEWARQAGGQAVWAHPRAVSRSRVASFEAIESLADHGLFGVEVNHRDNPPADQVKLHLLARRLGLAEFGSSDFHGAGKPNALGENVTDQSVIQELEHRSTLEVIVP